MTFEEKIKKDYEECLKLVKGSSYNGVEKDLERVKEILLNDSEKILGKAKFNRFKKMEMNFVNQIWNLAIDYMPESRNTYGRLETEIVEAIRNFGRRVYHSW